MNATTKRRGGSSFYARFEVSEFGTRAIETEHLLLGLIRQDRSLLDRLVGTPVDEAAIRQQITNRKPMGEKVPTRVDVPLSMECKRVLMFTSDEARRLNHHHIGTEHLFLGLLAEEGCFAAEILRGLGLRLEKAREDLAKRASGT